MRCALAAGACTATAACRAGTARLTRRGALAVSACAAAAACRAARLTRRGSLAVGGDALHALLGAGVQVAVVLLQVGGQTAQKAGGEDQRDVLGPVVQGLGYGTGGAGDRVSGRRGHSGPAADGAAARRRGLPRSSSWPASQPRTLTMASRHNTRSRRGHAQRLVAAAVPATGSSGGAGPCPCPSPWPWPQPHPRCGSSSRKRVSARYLRSWLDCTRSPSTTPDQKASRAGTAGRASRAPPAPRCPCEVGQRQRQRGVRGGRGARSQASAVARSFTMHSPSPHPGRTLRPIL